MKHGLFTGVGVGPGDPELLTLKAVKAIEDADIIIAPRTEKRDDSIALAIAKPYVKKDAQVIELVFPMVYDEQRLDDSWQANREIIADYLRQGRHIIFLTLGDPMLYSTYIYVYRLLREDGFETATVPGVTSFAAICSRIGMPLTEGDDILSIIPATVSPQRLEQAMAAADRVVLMKVSRNFEDTCEQLRRSQLLEGAVMVSKCGQPEEEIEWDLSSRTHGKVPYLSTIIAGKTRSVARESVKA